ncbi:MAG: DegT/DnrJ/EryC1/StrS family aminotransferase, partial [Actinomycetota bacterium]|nr:DegT/DnrJ/EryC1/StrS family aminotransferase [Actinomycetota bacterium]
DAELARRVRCLGNHGSVSKNLHQNVGRNSRLDALQAAILSTKLPHLDHWVEARRAAVMTYRDRLAGRARLLQAGSQGRSACHLNVVQIAQRDRVRARVEREGIRTGIHYPVPCHQQEAYKPYYTEPLPIAEQAASEILSLPLFPDITREQIAHVCDALGRALPNGR